MANSLNNLTLLYESEGRYHKAESLYERSLEIRKKTLGSDHPDVGNSFNDLANVYGALGRYTEAESLYKRSLEIIEKALGPDHPYLVPVLVNMVELYNIVGKEEARSLEERLKVIRSSSE